MSQNAKNSSKSGADGSLAPGFLRRLAIVAYDVLLLIAVLFLATALLLPFGNTLIQEKTFYRLYLLIVSFIFYGWFWTHGGQTLGLRAWKARVLTFEQQPITWLQAFMRFVTALASCGLSLLWIPLDRHRRSWHDYLSKTAVFFEPKK